MAEKTNPVAEHSSSAAGSAGSGFAPAAGPPAAGAKPHGPPAALPFILAIVVPLLYSLFAGPLFQVRAGPRATSLS